MKTLSSLLLLFSAIVVSAQNSTALIDSLPASWEWTPVYSQPTPETDRWWENFNDPILTSLIREGLNNSYDVRIAYRRIKVAAQVQRQTRAGYSPDLSIAAGWNRVNEPGAISNPAEHVHSSVNDYFSLGLQMNWEIDVFGRVAQQLKADKAASRISMADYNSAQISLASNIATAYFQLRAAQANLDIADSNIKDQEKLLDIAITRHEVGLSPAVDVVQARLIVATTRAELPTLKNSVNTAINELSILTGVYPDKLTYLLTPAPLPEAPAAIAVAAPAELLRRRPDIISAEQTLAKQAAEVGVAKKDFLPVLSLSASVATEAHNFKNLFSSNSLAYSIAPQLSWTIFDGLARNARVAEARLNMDDAIDSYNLAILTAVQEVNNALDYYHASCDKTALLGQALKYSKRELELETDRYTQGLNAYSDVVTAFSDVLNAETSLLEARAQLLASLVSLYSAMGGGW